jgi:predicted nucleotidyltransferase
MHPLIENNRDAIEQLCRTHSVRRLWLFGSAARDDFNTDASDVDFLVDFGDVPSHGHADRYFGLAHGLEDTLQCKVDLIEIETMNNPCFRQEVERTRVSLYAA